MDVYWLEQRGAEVPPLDDWLSADETLRLTGMRFEKRRADWLYGEIGGVRFRVPHAGVMA